MPDTKVPRWLEWAREIQALAQTGYHYAQDDFQRDRCRRLTEIAAEIISQHAGMELLPLVKAYQAQMGYATPKVDVRAAVFRSGKLLMVRERADGGWTMPGGWADVGDSPSRAAEREAREEAGFHVKARRVIGVYDANRLPPFEVFHAFKVVFHCEIMGGEAASNDEISEVGFFGPEEIPSPLSAERTPPRIIEDAFGALRSPDWAAHFD